MAYLDLSTGLKIRVSVVQFHPWPYQSNTCACSMDLGVVNNLKCGESSRRQTQLNQAVNWIELRSNAPRVGRSISSSQTRRHWADRGW
jgi:hypothetical protein